MIRKTLCLLATISTFIVGVYGQKDLVRTVTKSVPCFDPEKANNGDTVFVKYVGTLAADGKEFDSNLKGEPISFVLGEGKVIQGWEQGLLGTCPGENIKLEIPSELGYGSEGAGNGVIPPNADLVFEVELINLKKGINIEVTKNVTCSSDKKTRDKDTVSFNYIGKLANGTIFDNTYDANRSPLEIEIGATGIKGWDLALSGACIGEKRIVIVPPELGYGEKGAENLVPPNALLILEIEILSYQDRVIGFLNRFSAGKFEG